MSREHTCRIVLCRTTICGLMLVSALGCSGGDRRVFIQESDRGTYVRLMHQETRELRVCVMPPTVSGDLGGDDQEYWGKTLQTQIESELQNRADRNGIRIVLVSPPEDHQLLLEQGDLRAGGYVQADPSNQKPNWTDWDLIVQSNLRVSVREEQVRHAGVRVPGGIPYVGGRNVVREETLPRRCTSVHATFKFVTNRGERHAPMTVSIEPVISEAGRGYIRTGESISHIDQDVDTALSRVAPAFAAEFFPESREQSVPLDSCRTPHCEAALQAVAKAAEQPEAVSAAVAAARASVEAHPTCHKAQFVLAIALELDGRYPEALKSVDRAIALSECDKDIRHPRESKRVRARTHPYSLAKARLMSLVTLAHAEQAAERDGNERQTPRAAPIQAGGSRLDK